MNKGKWIMYALLFFILMMPFVSATFSIENSVMKGVNEYCQITSIVYTSNTAYLSFPEILTYSVIYVDPTNSTDVNITTYYVNVTNKNETQANDWGSWVPWAIGLTTGPVGYGIFSALNSQANLILDIKMLFSVTGPTPIDRYGFNLQDFPLSAGKEYQIKVCQNRIPSVLSPGAEGLAFMTTVRLPEEKYQQCSEAEESGFSTMVSSTGIYGQLFLFMQWIYQLWLIVYWIIKIGIVIGVIWGIIWLVTYVYRLVRNILQ